ncbi:ATP-binding protein [Streptomyces antimicrobicus]|uniref:ATP-binding protein n=1 Tax=Streptomyces antimicrobicus TaxID=2883108 RepID=A0ABS8AZR0_9ACTN|nr:ATP-binding protein [Streptomyces antimicrobicus]MCB5177839.1 ATP-binding protein [Streptomyces antimicrobicus]
MDGTTHGQAGQAGPQEQPGAPLPGTPGAAGTPAAPGAPAAPGTPATPATPAAPGAQGAPARVVRLTAGEFTLTVNPVDGSEIEARRPGDGADRRPAKRDAASRAAHAAAGLPPVPPGAPRPLPLLERDDERERLVRLLSRGRSVRLTGPAGSGRSVLLDAVARDCEGIAPDGVVRLSGHRRSAAELLHALYAAVYEAPGRRPERIELLARVREIGAVVVLDDLELGGHALDELLRDTPECAWLLAATPDVPAPSDDSHLEEMFLGGLSRAGCEELLERTVGRALTEAERAWAGDLRFASEGLALRFVQAGGLLRQRDEINRRAAEAEDEDEPGVFEERPRDLDPVPLPSLAEGAAPAELLAARVSESARAALRFAVALGGEMPHPTHLPALVGDTHADTAVAELLECGLLTAAGSRYRLAAGVARQLLEAGFEPADEARTAARHYAWWTGHSSVTPERVAAEADAVLAALAGADVVAGVMLARTAAPAFAASLDWGAWERVLRAGAEAARTAGEVAEQAYFHHELGVLALCQGRLDRARAELETSIGLRGALADKHGTVAGRRALALVTDHEITTTPAPPLRLEAPDPATAPGRGAPEAVTRPTPAAGTAGPLGGPKAAPRALGPGTGAPAGAPGSEAVTEVTPRVGGTAPGTGPGKGPGAAAAPAGSGTGAAQAGPGGSARKGLGGPGVGAVAGAGTGSGTGAGGTAAGPAAGPGNGSGSAVTQVIRPVGGPGPDPQTLSEVFGSAFPAAAAAPTAPQPRVPAAPARAEGPAWRRRPVLLAAGGALVAVVLGTVAALAVSSDDEPGAPATSPTPGSSRPDAVPGGNDPAQDPGSSPGTGTPPAAGTGSTGTGAPGTTAPPSTATGGTGPGTGPGTGTGSAGPSRRPSTKPTGPTASSPGPKPSQSPSAPDPTGPSSPGTPTGPTDPPTGSAGTSTSPSGTTGADGGTTG